MHTKYGMIIAMSVQCVRKVEFPSPLWQIQVSWTSFSPGGPGMVERWS